MIEIEIDKEKVIRGIERITGYTGARSADGTLYSRIATTDSDAQLLGHCLREGTDTIAYALRHSLAETINGDDSVRLLLQVSAAFDPSLTANIGSDLTNYLVHYVTARWFAITNPEASAQYAASATALLDNASRLVHHKKKPSRPKY